jgi:hypothetical protein
MTKSKTFDEKGNGWKPISRYNKGEGLLVDLWLEIHASPLSFGLSDSFGTHNAYLKNGEWFDNGGKLNTGYIKEWRIPQNTILEHKERK